MSPSGSTPPRGRRIASAGAAALGTTVVFAPGADAATFEVTSTADSGAGTLRQAIIDANGASGADEITFASGVTGQITLATGQLAISDSVTITGPGAGQLAVDGGGASRVFEVYSNPTNIAVTIEGLTISGGAASHGAGVRNTDEDLTLDGVTIRDNAATSDGGGLWADGFNMDLTIRDSEITGNTAGADGGGVYIEDTGGPLRIERTTISGNAAGQEGGGIYFYDPDTSMTLDQLAITGNTAATKGGGIYLYDTDATGTLGLTNSTISGNTAATGGGIYLYGPDNPVLIENTTVSGNTATGAGAGGIEVQAASTGMTFRHTTIAGNQTAGTVGGLRVAGGTFAVDNTVVADNGGTQDVDGPMALDNSLIETVGTATPTGDAPLTGDPLLGALADNGGPTQTQLPQPSSPLVDAGADLAIAADQRGRTRPSGAGPDIGAVEVQMPAVTAIAPANGTAGTVVTVTGTRFTGASAVAFGATAATSFTVVDDTTITATVPAGTGAVDVRVTNDAIQSPIVPAGTFTYNVAPTPTATPNPTPGATPAPTPAATPAPTPKPPVKLTCASRRIFTLTLPAYTKSARVKLGSKVLKGKRKGGRLVYTVDLRRRLPGTYSVRIEIRSKGGRKITQTRRFRTCRPPKAT